MYTSSFYLRLVQRNGHPFVIGHLYPQEYARFIFGQNSVPSLLTYDPQVILELTEKTFLLFCIKFVEPDQGWFDTYNNRVKFVGIAPNKEAKTYGADVIIGRMWNPESRSTFVKLVGRGWWCHEKWALASLCLSSRWESKLQQVWGWSSIESWTLNTKIRAGPLRLVLNLRADVSWELVSRLVEVWKDLLRTHKS